MLKPGIFRQNYIVCEIVTKTKGWQVKRTEKDFLFLRTVLSKLYPGCLIPLLPENSLAKDNSNSLIRSKRSLQHFLDEIVSHPLLSTAVFLKEFLRCSETEFDKQKSACEASPPKDVSECYSIGGSVTITYSHNLSQFCTKILDSAPTLRATYHE